MAEIKTKVSNASVKKFISLVEPKEKRNDSTALLKIFKDATGLDPKMWGTSIIGYGMYHYESTRSSQKGDWPLVAFSPRKQNLTIYIMPGFKGYDSLIKNLGKAKTSVGCLYIKKLSDVNTTILSKLIKKSFLDAKKKFKVK